MISLRAARIAVDLDAPATMPRGRRGVDAMFPTGMLPIHRVFIGAR
jgi:hypothetical protein